MPHSPCKDGNQTEGDHRRELQEKALDQIHGEKLQPSGKPQHIRGETNHLKSDRQCTRCGYDQHRPGEKCLAMGSTCHNCGKKGHFSARCFSRSVAAIHDSESDSDERKLESAFLGTMSHGHKLVWSVKINVKHLHSKWIQEQKSPPQSFN